MRQFSYLLLALAIKSCAALPSQAIVDTAASSVSSGNLQVDFEGSGYGELKPRDSVRSTITRTSTITTSAQSTTSVSSSSSPSETVSSSAAGSVSTTSISTSSTPTSAPPSASPSASTSVSNLNSDSSTVPTNSASVSQAPAASGTQAISPAPTAAPTAKPFVPSPPSPSLSRPPPQKDWAHIGIAIGVFTGVAICALSAFAYVRHRILKSINEKRAAKFARDGLAGGRKYGAKGPTINVTDADGEDKGAEMAELGRSGLNAGKGHVRARSSVSGRPRKESVAVEHGPRLPPRNVEKYEVPSISWEGRRRMLTAQGLQIWDVAKTWPGQLGRKGGEARAKVAATVTNGWPKRRDA